MGPLSQAPDSEIEFLVQLVQVPAHQVTCEPTTDRQYVSANASLSFRLHEPPGHRRGIWRLRALRPRPVSRPHARSG